jgi:hypothetical protein
METEWIDKVEVVNRQIKESVRLFFEQRDPVAIHTLIASAHQILFDLGKHKGVESVVKNTKVLEKKGTQELLKNINYPYNFFKHADRDPESKINVAPLIELTEDFILDAIVMLQGAVGSIPFEAKVYWFWFVSKHHEGFDNLPADSEIRKMQEQNIGEWDFSTILEFIKFVDVFGGIDAANKALNQDAQ